MLALGPMMANASDQQHPLITEDDDPVVLIVQELRGMRKELQANTRAIKVQAKAVEHLAILLGRMNYDMQRISQREVDA